MTRGLDNSLFLYNKPEWEAIADKLSKLPLSASNSRAFARLMLAGAWDVELDKQGRIVLPDYLRKFARLTKKIVITGLYNRIEIWDHTTWADYKKNAEKESTNIAENLGDLGI